MKLQLEFRNEFIKKTDTFKVGQTTIMMTPPIGEDYWIFRIKLREDQAIVAFPKFGTIGIGFALEEDWNTNLPYSCETENIYKHIRVNKKYKQITKKKCIEALTIIQKACKYYKEHEMEVMESGDASGFVSYFGELQEMVKGK